MTTRKRNPRTKLPPGYLWLPFWTTGIWYCLLLYGRLSGGHIGGLYPALGMPLLIVGGIAGLYTMRVDAPAWLCRFVQIFSFGTLLGMILFVAVDAWSRAGTPLS